MKGILLCRAYPDANALALGGGAWRQGESLWDDHTPTRPMRDSFDRAVTPSAAGRVYQRAALQRSALQHASQQRQTLRRQRGPARLQRQLRSLEQVLVADVEDAGVAAT
jgi:hypothetical protein